MESIKLLLAEYPIETRCDIYQILSNFSLGLSQGRYSVEDIQLTCKMIEEVSPDIDGLNLVSLLITDRSN